MKISKEHRDYMAAAIAPLDTNKVRADYRAGAFPHSGAVRDLDKRYRNDLFRAAGLSRWACDTLYPLGVTDVHIDSALRSIVTPL